MAAVKTAVTGLSSTGANVVRGRVYQTDSEHALSVYMGSDSVISESGYSNMSYVDRLLEVIIRIHVKTDRATSVLDTKFNASRAEIFAAMASDYTLGLGFVINAYPAGDDAPEVTADSDQPSGTQDMKYHVHYRHSITSAEA